MRPLPRCLVIAMGKHKWLLLECDKTPELVVKALLAHGFQTELGRGFRATAKVSGFVSSSYVEKVMKVERIVDPFGSESEVETTRYVAINFRLHFRENNERTFLLEVVRPPRSIRTMLSELSEVMGRIAVSEINLPLIEIFKELRLDSPRARIVKLKASRLGISMASVAKVEVSSSVDAYRDYSSFFGESKGFVEKIKIERPFIDSNGALEIGVNGLCSFDEKVEDLVRELVLKIYRQI